MAPPSMPVELPTRGLFDKVVEINVGQGEQKKSFPVHEGLIRHYSGYFEAALGGNFAEAKSHFVDLVQEDPIIFEQFVYWLYTGKVGEFSGNPKSYDAVIRLWLFGDRRQIPLLCNTIIDVLKDMIAQHWQLPSSEFKFVYENTVPNSALRKFFVWVTSNIAGPSTGISNWPVEMVVDVAQILFRHKETGTKRMLKSDFAKADVCEFHQHEDGVKCGKTVKSKQSTTNA